MNIVAVVADLPVRCLALWKADRGGFA